MPYSYATITISITTAQHVMDLLLGCCRFAWPVCCHNFMLWLCRPHWLIRSHLVVFLLQDPSLIFDHL